MAFPTYRSSTTATGSGSVSPAKPSGLAVGDTLVGWVVGANANAITAPVGWTLIDGTDAGPQAAYSFYKVADASDVATSTFTFSQSGGANMTGSVIAIASDNQLAPLGAVTKANGFTGTPTAPTFTPTVSGGIFLILVAWNDGNTHTVSNYAMATDNPASWTEAFDTGTARGVAMGYANRGKITATGNNTVTLTTVISGGFYFIQAMNFVPSIPDPLYITATIPSPSRIAPVTATPISILTSIVSPTVSAVAKKWKNISKSTSTWLNTNKS